MTEHFLNYISSNYHILYSSFKKASFGRNLTEDLFHDAIIKVRDKIHEKGFKINKLHFSGQSFANYLFITCGNEVMMDKRKNNKSIIIYSDNDFEYIDEKRMPNELKCNLEDDLKKELEYISEDKMVDDILKFIRKRHIQLHYGIFEYYYRAGIGYRKLAEILGYKSYRSVWNIVNKVKDDIIENYPGKSLPHRIKIRDEDPGEDEIIN